MPASMSKRNAPVATIDEVNAIVGNLPINFVSSHCNTYRQAVSHPDGARRDALVVIEYDSSAADPDYPGIWTYRYAIYPITQHNAVGHAFATGSFPVGAGHDLSDDNLHRFACRLTNLSNIAVPTLAEASAMLMLGALKREQVRAYSTYLLDLYLDRVAGIDCGHGYSLADSCPSCGLLDDEDDATDHQALNVDITHAK